MPFVKKGNRRGFNFRRNAQLSENDNSEQDSDQITTPEQSEFLTLREDNTANELLPEYTEESESSVVRPLSLASVVMSNDTQNLQNNSLIELKQEIDEHNEEGTSMCEPLIHMKEKLSSETKPGKTLETFKPATCSFDYCRLCATSTHPAVRESIFGDGNKKSLGYFYKIKECIGLRIKQNDGLSSFICGNCKKLLVQFYHFRLKCKHVDSELKKKKKALEISRCDHDKNVINTITRTCNVTKVQSDSKYLKNKQENHTINYIPSMSLDNLPLHCTDDVKDATLIDEDVKDAKDVTMCPTIDAPSCHDLDIKEEPLLSHAYQGGDIKDVTLIPSNASTSTCGDEIRSLKVHSSYKDLPNQHFEDTKSTRLGSSTDVKERCISRVNKDQNKKQFVVKLEPKENGTKKYMCDICGLTVSRIRNHMVVHKTADAKYSFKCTSCDKGFCTNFALRQHMNIHLSLKPFVCKVCGKSFIKNELLKKHMIIHTGERKYKCYLCEKRFQSGYNLKTHIRSHTGERPYKCPHCVATFTHRATLNPHVKKCTLNVNHDNKHI